MYYSKNAGATWSSLGLPVSGGDNPVFPSIASSLANQGNVVFYSVEGGTATGANRLWVSLDYGQTWNYPATTYPPSQVPGGNGWHNGYEIATSPANPGNVYVLDAENLKLYYGSFSTAGGAAAFVEWTPLGSTLPFGPPYSNPSQPNYNFSQAWYDYHLECGNRVSGANNQDHLYLGLIDIQETVNPGQGWTSIGDRRGTLSLTVP